MSGTEHSGHSRRLVLVVARDGQVGELLAHHITSHWSDAGVDHASHLAPGEHAAEKLEARYDAVLVTDDVDDDGGIATVLALARGNGAPPVLFMGRGDERQVVAAVKAGAFDYVPLDGLSHERLVQALESACDSIPAARASGFSPGDSMGGAGLGSLRSYLYERTLSDGESASVYLARERDGGDRVALKVLHRIAEDDRGERSLNRFLREFQVIADIDHPGIVKIFDMGVADDHAYIVMEFCSHGSLKRRIGEGIAPPRAFDLIRDVADALGALHASGICHRDLKPTNVMFREPDSPVLIDFGLARDLHFAAVLTGRGEIFGTPYYMSPEQGHGQPADHRSDIYSLGIIFFEMLSGQRPYDGDTAMSVIIQHGQGPVPTLPDDLAGWQPAIDRMLAKDPADRFQSTDELLDWAPSP